MSSDMFARDYKGPDGALLCAIGSHPRIRIKTQGEIHDKGWGSEEWIHNDKDYCGKILAFNSGAKFSMHFHALKKETFYVLSGRLLLKTINLNNADPIETELQKGEIVEIPQNVPHQLEALEASKIIEFSTEHFEWDSYRIAKGDSQK